MKKSDRSLAKKRPIITLLTDFGCSDWFVASMKGVILSIAPDATIVDITHNVPAHNVLAGAYLLRAASTCFPRGTVHVAVVDPGVGTARRPIVVETRKGLLVGPDNGLLSLAADEAGIEQIFWAHNQGLFLPRVSKTFHGRDLFAPLAAHLAAGLAPSRCGPRIKQYTKLREPLPRRVGQNLKGKIIWVDGFGNLITNIREGDLANLLPRSGKAGEGAKQLEKGFPRRRLSVSIGACEVRGLDLTYGQGREGELIALINSAGLLEIAARRASAAAALQAGPGSPVRVKATISKPGSK